jgi:signal transduction histidine kinase
VLTNLVVNAIDAYKDAGKDGGEIRINVSEAGDMLEVRVSDHGCGIPPENMGKIFDEFFSTKALGEGTGLGLSIARDIITNFFRGTINVESVPEQGSVFILRLPRGSHREDRQPLGKEPPLETVTVEEYR